MRHQHAEEFAIAFTLLTDGVSGTGGQEFALRLPKFEEQFNLLARPRQQVRLGKGQVGDVEQINRPVGKSSLARRERTLVEARLFL